MQTSTGAIAQFENEKDAKKAGFDKRLTDGEARLLMPLSRSARRKWARDTKNNVGAFENRLKKRRRSKALVKEQKREQRRRSS